MPQNPQASRPDPGRAARVAAAGPTPLSRRPGPDDPDADFLERAAFYADFLERAAFYNTVIQFVIVLAGAIALMIALAP